MITDAIIIGLKLLDKGITAFFDGLAYTFDHLFQAKHIRARHYMCCKRHLRDSDYGKQTVW